MLESLRDLDRESRCVLIVTGKSVVSFVEVSDLVQLPF